MMKEDLIRLLEREGFSEKIIRAFERVNRENFIPEGMKEMAYENIPLEIGHGQTISQPYTIAFMLGLLELREGLKVLEVGSGSGYVLALMNEMIKGEFYGVERIKELTEKSKKVLKNKKNIKVIHGNGSKGFGGNFDRILVSASAKGIPQKIIKQLKLNGVLVCPVRNSIFRIKKKRGENEVQEYPGFIFVPLVED